MKKPDSTPTTLIIMITNQESPWSTLAPIGWYVCGFVLWRGRSSGWGQASWTRWDLRSSSRQFDCAVWLSRRSRRVRSFPTLVHSRVCGLRSDSSVANALLDARNNGHIPQTPWCCHRRSLYFDWWVEFNFPLLCYQLFTNKVITLISVHLNWSWTTFYSFKKCFYTFSIMSSTFLEGTHTR